MPVILPTDLPAVETLGAENIFVMTEKRALTQDIRPLLFANWLNYYVYQETPYDLKSLS